MPTELTEPVVINEFDGKTTKELTVYTLYLLGLIEGMNTDRSTTKSIVQEFNAMPRKVPRKG